MGRPEPLHSTGTQETVCKYKVQSTKAWADQPETPRLGACVCRAFIFKVTGQSPVSRCTVSKFEGRQGKREGKDHGVETGEIQLLGEVRKEDTIRSRSFVQMSTERSGEGSELRTGALWINAV